MGKVRIVTDSNVCLPPPLFRDRHPLEIVPIQVTCGSLEIGDDPALSAQEVIQYFDRCQSFPQLTPPTVEDFQQVYENLRCETDQIISIHSSGALSGTVQNALLASRYYLGRCNIQVIDTKTISAGLGMIVQAAQDVASRNFRMDDVIRIIRGMIARMYSIFFLDDLSYLELNNLISRSQAILGNMLGVLAFLTLEDGEIVPMEKVNSRGQASEKLIEFVSEFSHTEQIAILRNGAFSNDEIQTLSDRLVSLHPRTPLTVHTYGPSTATCIGPRSLGVMVLESEENAL